MPAQAVSLGLAKAEEDGALQRGLVEAERATRALAEEEAERVRRELQEAVSAAAAAAESAAEQKKVLYPSPRSIRFRLTRHGSVFSHLLVLRPSAPKPKPNAPPTPPASLPPLPQAASFPSKPLP